MTARAARRGGIRCDVAADVAKELIAIAELREAKMTELCATLWIDRIAQGAQAAALNTEALTLRSIAYAINKSMQP
jgi:hypothetical protein